MPAPGGVEGELADGDAHAAAALVAEAEDALVVGDDDEADVFAGHVAQEGGDAATSSGVIHRPRGRRRMWLNSWQARPTVGRVDDGHQLLEVVEEDAVEEGLVAVLEARHSDVLLERRALGADLADRGRCLLCQCGDAVRQHAADAKLVPLRATETGRLVGGRVLKEPDARLRVSMTSGPARSSMDLCTGALWSTGRATARSHSGPTRAKRLGRMDIEPNVRLVKGERARARIAALAHRLRRQDALCRSSLSPQRGTDHAPTRCMTSQSDAQSAEENKAIEKEDAAPALTRRRRGFAAMPSDKQREVARRGGRAAHERGTAHEFSGAEAREAGRRGGLAVARDREYMSKIGREGARKSAAVRKRKEPES